MEPIKKPELELSDRDRKEIALAHYYVHFLESYGTDGNIRLNLIDKLVNHIQELEGYIADKESE